MTKEQIFKEAVSIAEKKGYELPYIDIWCANCETSSYLLDSFDEDFVNMVIFSHDFAKAFWGKEDVCGHCGTIMNEDNEGKCCYYSQNSFGWFEKLWEYHLMRMVREREPLRYIEKFLKVANQPINK